MLVPRRKLIGLGAGALAAPLLLRAAAAQDFLTGVGTKKGSGNGGTPAFSPDRLIGKYGLFFRADVGVTQSSGNVSNWADSGPYGVNLPVGGGTAPQWSATRFNASHPGVGFGSQAGFGTGSGDSLGHFDGYKFWSTTFSLFFGMTLGSTLVANSQIGNLLNGTFVQTGPSGNGYGFLVGVPASSGGITVTGVLGNGGSYVTVTTGSPQMLGTIATGSVGKTYIGQTAQGSSVPYTAMTGMTPRDGGGMGSFTLGSGSNAANMVIAWCLMTERVLSVTDISNLASWSNSVFGTSF